MDIGIVVGQRAGSTVVAVTGDIDLQTAGELEAVLVGIDNDIVVDLTDTAFLDSTGLGLFVGTDNRLRSMGRALSFICPTPGLRKIFRITRLDDVWPIHDSFAAAGLDASEGGRRE